MTEAEKEVQQAKHRKFVDVQSTLMLATITSWQNTNPDTFREYMDSAFQIAWGAVYRGNEDDQKVVADAEQVVAKYELAATLQGGGKVQ